MKYVSLVCFITVFSVKIFAQNWDTKALKVGYITGMDYATKIERFFVSTESKLLMINPYTASVIDSIFIGGNIPNQTNIGGVSVSDDGQFVYTSKPSENKILRYRWATKTKDLEINVGEGIGDVKVMPGRGETIIVTRFNNRDAVVYDREVMRPKTTKGDFEHVSHVVFAHNDTTTVYGSYDLTTGNSLHVLKIDNSGISIQKKSIVLEDFRSRYLASKDGFIYTHNGAKINLKTLTAPFLEGVYGASYGLGLVNYLKSDYFVADPDENKVYSLVESRFPVSEQLDSVELAIFNKTTFNFEKVVKLGVKFTPNDYIKQMKEWGSGKLVVVAGDKIVFMRTCTPKITAAPTIVEGRKKVGCNDDIITLTASGTASRYIWSTGDTGRTIKITASDSQFEQIFSVASLDTEGCSSPYSLPTSITYERVTDIPTFTIGEQRTVICKGDSINLIANTNLEQVIWSNGAKGNSIWVKQTGSYSMYGLTSNGCKSATSGAQSVTVYDFPIPPRPTIKIEQGDTVVCENSSISLSATAGYSLYRWSNGDNTRFVSITPTQTFQEITVRVSDSNGCQSFPSLPITLEKVYNPSMNPMITLNGNVLASSISEGNQWFLNGNLITGANKQFYLPTTKGTYTVRVANRACFSDFSNGIQF
jgi:hypothetical protein